MSDENDLRGPAELGLGATGKFPGGKITPDDEGELRLAVRAFPARGIVAVDFGKNVSWLGLDKETALGLAEILRDQAGKLP